MTLNPNGPISIGGSTTGQSINLEIGRAATAQSSLNETELRNLAGIPSGQISMFDFYGKSAGTAFLLLCNTNAAKDDNFVLTLRDNTTGVNYSLDGVANFNFVGEQTTYVWLANGMSLSTFLARPGVATMISSIANNPTYRGTFALPAISYSLQKSITITMTNVQNNNNANFGIVAHGISSASGVSWNSGAWSAPSPWNITINTGWGTSTASISTAP